MELNKPKDWIDSIDFSDRAAGLAIVAKEFDGWAPALKALITDGETAPVARPIHALPINHRWDRMAMSMERWQYWLFTGVLSWAGAPFFEEIFARGYCQRRLAEDWGDGPAIAGAACLFTFGHSQYFVADPYNVGMLAGLLLSAIGFGLVFAWTRSLVPAMVAHAVFDIPMSTVWQGVLLAGLVIGAAVVWRRAVPIVKQVFSTGSGAAGVALGTIGAGYAALSSVDRTILDVVIAAYGMLLAAIFLEAKDRRRDRSASASRPQSEDPSIHLSV